MDCDMFHKKKVKAKKDHECSECNCEIYKGMLYWRIAGVWYGVFSSIKRCLFCEELGKLAQDSEGIYDEDTANLYGGLYEDIDKLSGHFKRDEKEPEFMYWCSILSADENDWLPEDEYDTLKAQYNFRKDS